MEKQLIYLYGVVSRDGEFVDMNNQNVYTKKINKAALYFDKLDAECDVTEPGEKVRRFKLMLIK